MNRMSHMPTKTTLAGLLLATLCLLAFLPALDNELVWDSVWYLGYNEFWVARLRFEHLVWMFVTHEMSNWHPLTWLSWAIDYQVYGGLDARGFHLTNILFHAANSVLVFVIFRQLLGRMRPRGIPPGSGFVVLAAWLAALLFAVHPQRVESVVWVAERKDVLCLFFSLWSLLYYLRYATAAGTTATAGRDLGKALLFFVLAGMSKPMAVTLPALLLLIDWHPLGRMAWSTSAARADSATRTLGDLIREKRWFFVFSAFLIAVTLVAQQEAARPLALATRLANAAHAAMLYLQQWAWPNSLSPFHPLLVSPDSGLSSFSQLAIAGFIGLTAIAIAAFRKGHAGLLASWLFYLVTLSPVLGVVTAFGLQGAADRYTYLSTLPLYLMVAWALLLVFRTGRREVSVASAILALSFGAWLTGETREYTRDWQSQVSLWTRAKRVYPDDPFINHQLGAAYIDIGRPDLAAPYLDRSAELGNQRIDLLAWRGQVHMRLANYDEALKIHHALARHGLSEEPPRVDMYCVVYNIGWNLAQLNRFEEAGGYFSRIPGKGSYGEYAEAWQSWLSGAPEKPGPSDREASDRSALPAPCFAPLMEMRRRKLRAE